MEIANDKPRVVVSQRGSDLVITFFGVPIFTEGGSGAMKLEADNVALVALAPVCVALTRMRDEEKPADLVADLIAACCESIGIVRIDEEDATCN
jgi:hypothetical protein